MFITTPDQDYIMSVLQKTRYLRTVQASRLLNKFNDISIEKNKAYTQRLLSQLKHIGKIIWITNDIFALPQFYRAFVDNNMLSAVDIMLDLTDYRILSLSNNKPPFKLCFFTGQENSVGNYGVIVVPRGFETEISASLFGIVDDKRTAIFLLEELSQKDRIKTSLPHFFTVNDGGFYRYYKGGG